MQVGVGWWVVFEDSWAPILRFLTRCSFFCAAVFFALQFFLRCSFFCVAVFFALRWILGLSGEWSGWFDAGWGGMVGGV